SCEKTGYLPEKKPGEFWAAYIGTIGRCYDIKTLLKTAGLLKSSHPNIKFFIAGDGPEYNALKNIAAREQLTNCDFLGLLKYG
ncbi:unnamed protein product, partial [marine sediment metagenome]